MEIERTPDVDLSVRIELCHAALQHLADQNGIDLLHIKGIAFKPRWRSRTEGGSDADVLVRPSHVHTFTRVLRSKGWSRRSTFRTGSASGHAETYWHDHLGYADVHRFFMGMGRDEPTFDVLWGRRQSIKLAGHPCPVPDGVSQALIFSLNEARNARGVQGPPRVAAELDASTAQEIEALVPRVAAEVGWAAASGRLEDVRDRREHDLWRVTLAPAGRIDEWRARIKAEPTARDKVITVLRAPLVNTDHLSSTRGHRPSPAEVVVAFVDRARRAVREIRRSRPGGVAGRERPDGE